MVSARYQNGGRSLRPCAGQELLCHLARGGGDAQSVRLQNGLKVQLERCPAWRQAIRGNAEESSRHPALRVISLSFRITQRRQNKLVRDQSAVDQRGVDPAKGVDFVSLVTAAIGKAAGRFRQGTANALVPAVQMPSRGKGLVDRAKDHGEHDAKGLMKAADGSCSVLECWAMAVATQGWASWSRAARPAARNRADSRLIFQLIEVGPKMLWPGSGADVLISASRPSRSAADTERSLPSAIPAYRIVKSLTVPNGCWFEADKKPSRELRLGAAQMFHSGGDLIDTDPIGRCRRTLGAGGRSMSCMPDLQRQSATSCPSPLLGCQPPVWGICRI